MLISESDEWKALVAHVSERNPRVSVEKCRSVEAEGMVLDYTRQRADDDTLPLLLALAEKANLKDKIAAMFRGDIINETEQRAAFHVALRASEGPLMVNGEDQFPLISGTLREIETFSNQVRSGEWLGRTGKKIENILAIGIGGSYLGPEFLYEALKLKPHLNLLFIANVDPVDFEQKTKDLDPDATLAIVVSKSFTTAETMLNANLVKKWLGEEGVEKHFVAVSTQLDLTREFGIDKVFPFGDYVGGRFSVHSPVGMLPISLAYGYDVASEFLAGARSMDAHFATAEFSQNIPVLLGLWGLYNSSFQNLNAKALLPYSQSLLRFAAHVQQLDCESNGKSVAMDGTKLPFETGEIVFGEPGTNGQHSFYQLLHQGRVVPCEFVGFKVSNSTASSEMHDELMCNFFAQPDALATGQENVENPHKNFDGNRPSLSILVLSQVSPFALGRLLAAYEHRVAVQGFVWGINSFDQWGVQLGKVLAKNVGKAMKGDEATTDKMNPSTKSLLKSYLSPPP